MLYLKIFSLLVLLFIFYQDQRYRAVYWICFPLLGLLLLLLKGGSTGFQAGLIEAGYGLAFFLIQLLLLTVYFSIKHQRLINITHRYLGLGDILLLLVIPFYLSPGNYVLFYLASLIIVLVYALCTRNSNDEEKSRHIPLAGLQALFLSILMVIGFLYPDFTLYSDNWIYLFMVY